MINCSRHYILAGAPLKSKAHLQEAENLARIHQVELLRITAHYLLAYVDYEEGDIEGAHQRVNSTTTILLALESLNKKSPKIKEALNYDVLASDFSKDWDVFLAGKHKVNSHEN